VTTQVPGKGGNSNAKATDFPLVAQLPTNLACTGTVAGQQNVCIVRCENPVGPFGGCVPVQAVANNAAGGQVAAAGGCNQQKKRSVKMFIA
jgi:Egh16-like virulence factor